MRIIPTLEQADAIAAEHLSEAIDRVIAKLDLVPDFLPLDLSDLPDIPNLTPITRRCQLPRMNRFEDEHES